MPAGLFRKLWHGQGASAEATAPEPPMLGDVRVSVRDVKRSAWEKVAEVTDHCLDDMSTMSTQTNRLHEVALVDELSTMAVTGSLIAESRASGSAPTWWLLPDPIYAMADAPVFTRQRTLIETVMESEFAETSDDELEPAKPTSRLVSFARQQSQHVDTILPSAVSPADIQQVIPAAMQAAMQECSFSVSIGDPRADDCPLVAVSDQFEDTILPSAVSPADIQQVIPAAMQAAMQECSFSVSIGDPRADDCPLVAVSDQFEALTGYSREEIIGKNCRFLSRNCPIGEQDHCALRDACLKGTPSCKIIVNRRKSGDLFLNLLDLRGITVARNVRTREELWFLVAIQADVTHLDNQELPKDHMDCIHEVASRLRSRLAQELSLMALAGSSALGCLQGKSEVLWVPVDEPRWIMGPPTPSCRRQASSDSHLQSIMERVRQTSSRQVSNSSRQISTSRQASQGRPTCTEMSEDLPAVAGARKEGKLRLRATAQATMQTWLEFMFVSRGAFWVLLGGASSLVCLELCRQTSWLSHRFTLGRCSR
ncbi:White collar 1 protein [Symbiodinium microadriaticum]|uniref:White collar 1 protein n=1 Tax=Symbiodinium microadriaticum TaxID=2951 RepID=A0A1Q9F1A8_SYMMI|nr:White collar 1 protein [Symbiodinium microadriaticum]